MKHFLFLACWIALFAAGCGQTTQPVPPKPAIGQPDPGTLTPNSEQQGKAFSISTTAYYEAMLAASANDAARTIGLTLQPGGSVRMVTSYQNNAPAVTNTGSWSTNPAGNLLITLENVNANEMTNLEFRPDDNRLVYVGTEYGTEGLVLVARPPQQEQGNE